MKFLKNLYGMFGKILSAKFSSKMVLKIPRAKFVQKIKQKFLRYFGKVLGEFLEKYEIFLSFVRIYENMKIFEEIFGRFVGNNI